MVELSRLSLSVFFPCHNEQENVGRVVLGALEFLPTVSDDFEIIIVDDGSKDDTPIIADRLAAEHETVRVVHHEVNRGYGGALRSGFLASSKEWVFYTDGDGQFDIGDLAGILNLACEYDIVTCYRIDRKDSAIRRLNAWAWGKLVNVVLGLNVRDVDCAFKLFRREIFDRIEMRSEGALIDAEVLAKAHRAGYTMAQRGVRHYARQAGQQSGSNIRVILRAFRELYKLRGDILSDTR